MALRSLRVVSARAVASPRREERWRGRGRCRCSGTNEQLMVMKEGSGKESAKKEAGLSLLGDDDERTEELTKNRVF